VRQQHYHLVRTFQHAPDTNQQEPKAKQHSSRYAAHLYLLGVFLSPKILNPDANNTAAGMERICVSLLG